MLTRAAPFRSVDAAILRFRIMRGVGLAVRGVRRFVASGAPKPTPPPPAPCVQQPSQTRTPRVLLVDAHAPRPDLDSGSVRMVALIRLLADLGLTPALFVDDFQPAPVDAPLTPTDDVRSIYTAVDWIERHGDSLRLVVLSRHTVARHWLPLIRKLLPHVPVVFDTVDLHFIRELRQAEHARSMVLRWLAALTQRSELAVSRAADFTWVVSSIERETLSAALPLARVECISNIVDPIPHTPPMENRSDFVFVGNFRHEPNVDAALWLSSLWPQIRERCPGAQLRVIGPYLPNDVRRRLAKLEGVDIVGHAPDLTNHLLQTRVMLAPLRYGAGVKGKLNAAFACGLPVVGTPCAVEGMQLGAKPVAIVASEEHAFVEAAVRLYADKNLWLSVRNAATACLARQFSSRAVAVHLSASLISLGVSLENA